MALPLVLPAGGKTLVADQPPNAGADGSGQSSHSHDGAKNCIRLRLMWTTSSSSLRTRWQLRGAVKMVNQRLAALGLEKHPDKTFIGRIERGFDFLGYRFSPAGLTLAKKTIANFIEKASRLYEQKRNAVSAATALEMYARRWLMWATGGIVCQRHRSDPPSRYGPAKQRNVRLQVLHALIEGGGRL